MLEEADQKAYEALQAPKAIVVRYGYLKMVGEFPYDGDAKPGCGSKLVIRTSRGIELGEMLTTTCGNGGCGKSITRKQMLEYIENSGGRDYPFSNQGKIVRVATIEDLNEQAKLEAERPLMIKAAKKAIVELNLQMKLVDVEILLGRERVLFHYTSENWVDFRELVRILAGEFHTRIEMHQVSARDEARITADYEKCGQHCCCKQFLKVLKPISMRSAKVQKATLDPTKISGRCGRLMCCLRYEDETYEDLRKRLPHRKSRVITPDGFGTVMDTQILTQLALVQMDNGSGTAAYPIENIQPLPKDQDPGVPMPRDPRAPRQAPGPQAGPSSAPPQGGRSAPGDRQADRQIDRQGGQSDRGPRSGNNPNNPQARQPSGDRPERERSDRDRPERERADRSAQQPRRPSPGRPLNEDEIESKEGSIPIDPLVQDPQQGPAASNESRTTRPPRQGPPAGNASGQRPANDRQNDRQPDRQNQRPNDQSSGQSGPKPYKGFRSLRNQPPSDVPDVSPMARQDPGDDTGPIDNDADLDTTSLGQAPEFEGQGLSGPNEQGQAEGEQGDRPRRRRRRRGRGRGPGQGGPQGQTGGQTGGQDGGPGPQGPGPQ